MFSSSQSTLWLVLVPLAALLPAILCMVDISRHPRTRNFPPQIWLVICAFGNLVGLAAYLAYGQSDER